MAQHTDDAIKARCAADNAMVRHLSSTVSYLPSDQDKIDLAFLALLPSASNNDEIVEKIEQGQDVNVADERGNTLMHHVVLRGDGQDDFIALMREHGAVTDYKNSLGQTPLALAAAYRRLSYMKFFVAHGADLTVVDKTGMSLLHIACWSGHADVLEFLLQHKETLKHLETRNEQGRTPMHVASFRAPSSCCVLLREAGANPAVEDHRCNKPAHLAGRVGRRNNKELLEGWELALNVATAAVRLKSKSPPFGRRAVNKSPPFGRRSNAAHNASPVAHRPAAF